MKTVNEMAQNRLGSFVTGMLVGCATGIYIAFTNARIAIWVTGIMIFLSVLLWAYYGTLFDSEYLRQPRVARLVHWPMMVFAFLFGLGLSSAVIGSLGQAINWFLYRLPGKYLNWVALAVLPTGYAAHYFKKRNQLRYGVVEVLAGIATAIGATAKTEFQPSQGLAILGAIYVVARGFNNISDARAKAAPTASEALLPS